MSFELNYSYDGIELGDLYPISQGFRFSKGRNSVGEIRFQVSLRQLNQFCLAQNFDIKRMFTPIRSSLKVVERTSPVVSAEVVGGWLSATPSFNFGESADTLVEFVFVDWLGLTAGLFVLPPLVFIGQPYQVVVAQQFALALERTFLAGARWPISMGANQTMVVRTDSVEAPTSLKDFILRYSETYNFTGVGGYDVYVDANGVFRMYTRYGIDLSDDVTLSYPDFGGKYDVKQISFPQWDNYVSDIFLTGAGNGYETVSGANGAAIFSQLRNPATIANTGYWQMATSQSDISQQLILDDLARSYVKDTDQPFAIPSLVLDGNKFRCYAHDLGGELWVGDSVTVDVTNWAKELIPVVTPTVLRIDSVNVEVDKSHNSKVTLGMSADVA